MTCKLRTTTYARNVIFAKILVAAVNKSHQDLTRQGGAGIVKESAILLLLASTLQRRRER